MIIHEEISRSWVAAEAARQDARRALAQVRLDRRVERQDRWRGIGFGSTRQLLGDLLGVANQLYGGTT